MNENYNYADSSEIPELKGFDGKLTDLIIEELKREREAKEIQQTIYFKEFWLICETPIPLVYHDFKYKNRYLITRDKQTISEVKNEMKELSEMQFVDSDTIPKKKAGRGGRDWLAILDKIPFGKSWKLKSTEMNFQTIKSAIAQLVADKKIGKEDYTATQRTIEDVTYIYVTNCKQRKPKQPKEPKTEQPTGQPLQ